MLPHWCGVGAPLDGGLIRLMMVLKLLLLGRGAFEVRRQICTPTSTNQEDHVSMVAYGACRLQKG